MASTAHKAVRNAEARTRLNLAVGRLVKRLGVEESAPPPDPVPIRDREFRAIREIERLADRIEAIDAALKDEGYSAAPGSAGKVEPDPASEIPGTVESFEVDPPFGPLPEVEGEQAEAAPEPADEPKTAPSRAAKGKGRS